MGVTPPAQRRILHYGDKGSDVLAYGRALAKTLKGLGLVTVNARNGVYGDGMLKDTLRLQSRLRLEVDGKVGPLTWTAVDPKLDAYGRFLLTPKTPPPAPVGVRVSHEAVVLSMLAPRHYTQARPYAGTLAEWKLEGGDCSGTSILAYKLVGGPDPNHTSFDGYGWTGSLDQQGIRVSEAQTSPGDLIFYGPGSSEHVTIAIGGGECISHGSEGGPRRLPVHYRGDYLQTRRYA